eukprot:6505140-Pyramimonas_sp.AAC.1
MIAARQIHSFDEDRTRFPDLADGPGVGGDRGNANHPEMQRQWRQHAEMGVDLQVAKARTNKRKTP